MTDSILCAKLGKTGSRLAAPPFPGQLGEKIHQQISQEAWRLWLSHQTMLINEYRLSLIDPKAREFLRKEMENYFFGHGSDKPSGFVPPEQKN